MNKQTKINRAEAITLTAALAMAGTLAVLNVLLPLSDTVVSWTALLHASPFMLAAVGMCLIFADDHADVLVSSSAAGREKDGNYGR